MDIPSTHEGKVTSINLKVGDKVKQGSNVLVIELNESSEKSQKAETSKEVKPETKADIKKESPPEITSQAVAKKSDVVSSHETEVVVLEAQGFCVSPQPVAKEIAGVAPPLDDTGAVAVTDVTPVLATVIEPAPFVTLIPVPAVI